MPGPTPSRAALRGGRALTALTSVYLLVGGASSLALPGPAREAMACYGCDLAVVPAIGAALLACVVVHLLPPTRVLGAVLLTAYLGGAVATHVRIGDPPGVVAFPIAVAAAVWAGLLLRDPALRTALAPRVDRRAPRPT